MTLGRRQTSVSGSAPTEAAPLVWWREQGHGTRDENEDLTVKLDVRYFDAIVMSSRRITPHMARITFGGPDFAHFTSTVPDQHVKLFLPRPGETGLSVPPLPSNGDVSTWLASYRRIDPEVRPSMRSYTIRSHRPESSEVDIDFVPRRPRACRTLGKFGSPRRSPDHARTCA